MPGHPSQAGREEQVLVRRHVHIVAEALAVEAAVGVVHEAGGGGVGGAGGGGHHGGAVGGVVHVVGQSK